MPDIKFSNQYPYTDFHELNLDWVIKEVKYWSTKVGKTIQSIELTGTVGLVDTYTINYSDGTTSTFDVTNGNGIVSVEKTGTAGNVDTYTITLTDGSTTTFTVTNGAVTSVNGQTGSVLLTIIDAASAADAYSNLSTYAKGDFVVYNEQLYICVSPIGTPEAWNSLHWGKISLTDLISAIKNGKTTVDSIVYFDTWTVGRAEPGYNNYGYTQGAFSDIFPNTQAPVYFNDSVYRAVYSYFDTATQATANTLGSWITTSPAASTTGRPYVKINLSRLDNTPINTADLVGSVYMIVPIDLPVSYLSQHAMTVYVSPTGSDTNPGTSTDPFLTIQKAVNSGAGNIIVSEGTYAPFTITDKDYPINIRMADYPTYDGTEHKIKITGNYVQIYRCRDIRITDMWVTNSAHDGFSLDDVAYFELIRCWASDCPVATTCGFRFQDCNGVLRNCKAWDIALDGYNMHFYGNTQMFDCVAHDCGDDGVSHHDGCTGSVIGGEFYNCGKGGISTPTYGAEINVTDAYSHDNRYGIYAASDSDHPVSIAQVSNCAFKNNSVADVRVTYATVTMFNTIYDTTDTSGGTLNIIS